MLLRVLNQSKTNVPHQLAHQLDSNLYPLLVVDGGKALMVTVVTWMMMMTATMTVTEGNGTVIVVVRPTFDEISSVLILVKNLPPILILLLLAHTV